MNSDRDDGRANELKGYKFMLESFLFMVDCKRGWFRDTAKTCQKILADIAKCGTVTKNGHYNTCCWSKEGTVDGPQTCKCVHVMIDVNDLKKNVFLKEFEEFAAYRFEKGKKMKHVLMD